MAQQVNLSNTTLKYGKEKINGSLLTADIPKSTFNKSVLNPIKTASISGTGKENGWIIAKGFTSGEQTNNVYYKLKGNKSSSSLSILVADGYGKFLDPVTNSAEYNVIVNHIKALAVNAKKEILDNQHISLSKDILKAEKKIDKSNKTIGKQSDKIEKNNKKIERIKSKNQKLTDQKNKEIEKRNKNQSELDTKRKDAQKNRSLKDSL